MAQANVYTVASSVSWQTDKCKISTGTSSVTYNVNILYPSFGSTGNIFSNAAVIPANSSLDVFVGVGNELTITGSGFTAQELGTVSSGIVAVGR
jgi:hypothetical protein